MAEAERAEVDLPVPEQPGPSIHEGGGAGPIQQGANEDAPETPSKNGKLPDVPEDERRASVTSFQDVSLDQNQQAPGTSAQSTPSRAPAGSESSPQRNQAKRPAPVQQRQSSSSVYSTGSSAGTGATRVERSSISYSARTSTSTSHGGASTRKPILQGVLVISSFETIFNSKDAKRIPTLKAAAQKALDVLRAPGGVGVGAGAAEDRREDVFEPLKLACETKTNALMITSLDAIGKLVSYGFFNPPYVPATADEESRSEQENGASTPAPESFVRDTKSEQLSNVVVDTICSCFTEAPSGPAAAAIQAASHAGPDAVNLQIVKALLTLVLQDGAGRGLSVHQSSLVSPFFPAQGLRLCKHISSTRLSSRLFGRYTTFSCSLARLRTKWWPRVLSTKSSAASSHACVRMPSLRHRGVERAETLVPPIVLDHKQVE